jgi:MFS family permease
MKYNNKTPTSILAGQGPLVAIVFFGFLAVGIPIAALSLYVSQSLGYGTAVVGVVIGLQSAATVIFRHQGGTVCDQAGPRRAVLLGLPLAALSGLCYLAATLVQVPLGPAASLGLVLLGRIVMGVGEALFITGTLSWGIARLGPSRTGIVMSWQGIAMFVALGAGAPLGLNAWRLFGFPAVAGLTLAMPLIALAVALTLPAAAGAGGVRVPFYRVLGLIWQPGLVLGLATAPFASITAFVALDYLAHGWPGAGAAIAAFGVGYVAVRAFFSHLPDRLGGVPVASVSLAVEAAGQVLLWLAPRPEIAFAGACLTGAGFSLIFPSMGLEATRRVSAEQRGRAVGNFTAFFDLAIGVTGPVVGLAAGRFGYPSAFLIGTACALLGLVLLIGLRRQPSAAA